MVENLLQMSRNPWFSSIQIDAGTHRQVSMIKGNDTLYSQLKWWRKHHKCTDRGIEFSRWTGQKLWEGVGRGMLLMLKSLGGRECSWGYRDRKADEVRTVRCVRRHQLFQEILFYSRMRCHWRTFKWRVAWFQFML